MLWKQVAGYLTQQLGKNILWEKFWKKAVEKRGIFFLYQNCTQTILVMNQHREL